MAESRGLGGGAWLKAGGGAWLRGGVVFSGDSLAVKLGLFQSL